MRRSDRRGVSGNMTGNTGGASWETCSFYTIVMAQGLGTDLRNWSFLLVGV